MNSYSVLYKDRTNCFRHTFTIYNNMYIGACVLFIVKGFCFLYYVYMAIRRMSHQSRPPRRPRTDTTALLVNSKTGDDDGGGNGENRYNNSAGNHRVKLSLGRPKQVCDRGRRWFTGVFFFRFYLFYIIIIFLRQIRHCSEFECRHQ